MRNSTLSATRADFDLILPDDCQFDPVPGLSHDSWPANLSGDSTWGDHWASPEWHDITGADSGRPGRTIPRLPRAVKI